jgi:hypothetical protein
VDELIKAMAPAFAAGLAVQRLVDISEPVTKDLPMKKLIVNAVAVLLGVWLAIAADLGVLKPLGADVARWADVVVTGLIVSAGSEGFNSLFKFLGYAKEAKKSEATERAAATANLGATLDGVRANVG